ncbi:polyhydroxyalkanoate depolymerase [Desertibaculum subflavum]|uniref:polyhydroxyalkanoate depolymerase n=1 Tax=Desertibaculum subflavum TaxID=2268458 RepID=UPI000E65F8F0
MLYQLHELHRAALTPIRFAAEASHRSLHHPLNPLSYLPAGWALAAACDLFEHSTRHRPRPDFNIDAADSDGSPLAVTEEVVERHPFCDLLHFKREPAPAAPNSRVLIVAPMSGHFATLLRGTVTTMLAEHDVFITDWKNARDVPLAEGGFDLDDYIDLVIHFLATLGPGTHVMAVCQPSVPVLAAVALMAAEKHPATPPSMILMGGPVDTRLSPTTPNKLATSHPLAWFENTVIHHVPFNHAGFMRRVYPGFLQLTGFMSMNFDRHVDAHVRQFHHLIQGDGESAAAHRAFYDEYLAVMDLPAEYYLQTVDIVFQRHLLPDGKWESRGRKIDPSAIERTALMTIEGEFDDISGFGQTLAAQDLCKRIPRSRRLHYLQAGVGHYGVFNGSKWRKEISPRVAAFIRANER